MSAKSLRDKNYIVFDTEDDSPEVLASGKSGLEKRVTQIAALSGTGARFYGRGHKSVKQFIKWLKIEARNKKVYALNLQYDLGNLYGDELDEISAFMVGSRMTSAIAKGVNFVDALNLWPMKLADIGEAFGMKKGKLDVNSKEYLWQDVEILNKAVEFVYDLAEEWKLPKVPNTLGGLAVKLWQKMGGTNWHNDCLWTREALFGGRVELFQQECKGNLYYTDINSLYPYVMTFPFPTETKTVRNLDGWGVASIRIRVPETFVAPLPLRLDSDRIIYPYGTFEGIWTFHEIRNAVENGARILKIFDAVGTQKAEPYYAGYVRHFYHARKTAPSSAHKLFYKLLMNNLYGQLGMSGVVSRTMDIDECDLSQGGHIFFGRKMFVDFEIGTPAHANYLHAAYVSSYGRLELFKYLKRLEKRLIYCDTDSVIFSGKPNFPIGSDLGQMKLEGTADYARTVLPKTYVFGDDFVAKGCPKVKAKEYIENGIVKYDQPYKFREAIEFFERGNKKKLSSWRTVEKRLLAVYDKKELRNNYYYPKKACLTDGERLSLSDM